MRFFTTEAQRTLGVLLLVTVVVIAAVASGLVLLKGPVSAAFSRDLRGEPSLRGKLPSRLRTSRL